jgi:hypothetical protein
MNKEKRISVAPSSTCSMKSYVIEIIRITAVDLSKETIVIQG